MKDYYTKEQRAAYAREYRKKHLEHIKFCAQFYKGGEEVSLRKRVSEVSAIYGGMKAAAKHLDIPWKDLCDCMNGQRPVVPDRQIFRKLGLRVILKFERL